MTNKKSTYFSVFFLVCFVTSFCISTLQNFSVKFFKPSPKQLKHITLSSKEDRQSCNNDVLLEETENETEDNYEATLFVLPYVLSFFKSQALTAKAYIVSTTIVAVTTPIYISICNFRI